MQKISWKSLQAKFPKYAVQYADEFKELFSKSGKELSIEDIDNYLNTETSTTAYKIGSYIRYFQDNTGQIIGRVEVSDDNGDSRAFDASGTLQGYVLNGFTYNAQGELLAQSDIISSLLVKENRVQASKNSFKNLLNWFQASYEGKVFKSKTIGDYEVQLNEVSYAEGKPAYDHAEVAIYPIEFSQGKREPIKVKNFKDIVEAEEMYSKINGEEDFNLLNTKQADSPLEILVKDETGKELQRMDSVQFMKAMEAPRNMNVADGIKKYNETHSEKAELVVKKQANETPAIGDKVIVLGGKFKDEVGELQDINNIENYRDIATVNLDNHGIHYLDYQDIRKVADKQAIYQEVSMKQATEKQADERLINPRMHIPESYSPLYEERIVRPEEWTSYSMEDIYEEEEEQPKKYIPKKKQRGEYNLHEIVMTPEGRGRIVMKQVDYEPYSYTVALTGKDEITIVNESKIQRLASINKQAGYSYGETPDIHDWEINILSDTPEERVISVLDLNASYDEDDNYIGNWPEDNWFIENFEEFQVGDIVWTDGGDHPDYPEGIYRIEKYNTEEAAKVSKMSINKQATNKLFVSDIPEWFTFTNYDVDVESLNNDFGTVYDSFFIEEEDGEYINVYGMYGIIPFKENEVFPIVSTNTHDSKEVDDIDEFLKGGLFKQAKRNDARYYATVNLELWVDGDQLEYNDKIEEIQESILSEEQKIDKAKEVIESIITDALYTLEPTEYDDIVSTKANVNIVSLERDERYDNIDYAALFPAVYEIPKEIDFRGYTGEPKQFDEDSIEYNLIDKLTAENYESYDKQLRESGVDLSFKDRGILLKKKGSVKSAKSLIDIQQDVESTINASELKKDIEKVFIMDRNLTGYDTLFIVTKYEASLVLDKLQKLLPQYVLRSKRGSSLITVDERADKFSVKQAKSVGWLRDKFLKKIDKIADVAAEVNDEFKKEREDGEGRGISLIDYYTTGRYHEIEKPLSADAITKSQAEKLMEDLVYQFKTELFAIYNITSSKADEVSDEPKGVSMKDIEELEEGVEKESAAEDTWELEDLPAGVLQGALGQALQKAMMGDAHAQELLMTVYDTDSWEDVKRQLNKSHEDAWYTKLFNRFKSLVGENEKESAIEKEMPYYTIENLSGGYPSSQHLKDISEENREPEGKILPY